MKINFYDIIDRHSGIPAVVTLHGPTLNLHKQKIIDYQKENKILRFSVNNWYDYFDLSPSYWILSSSEDAFGVGKLLDTVCNHNVPLFYSDEGDFTDKTVIDRRLKDIEWLAYDQRHWQGNTCLQILKEFKQHYEKYENYNFKLRNLLKGVGQIVEWSIRDESLHSNAGCWLYRQLMEEKPELNTPELRESIKEAALLSLKLELDFIDKVYEMGDLEGCSKYDLVSFIKHRVNTKMGDLGYGPIVNGIDKEAVQRMKWFDSLSAGKQHTDFFANRVTNYSKGAQKWDAND